MNCKPGDLAITRNVRPEHAGRILQCIRFIGKVPGWSHSDRWETTYPHYGNKGRFTTTFPDCKLIPITPPEAEKEALRREFDRTKEKELT